jgi:phosphate-selective porin OprO/OprP
MVGVAAVILAIAIRSPLMAQGQQPSVQPERADLEQRIRELEAAVRRLQSQGSEPALDGVIQAGTAFKPQDAAPGPGDTSSAQALPPPFAGGAAEVSPASTDPGTNTGKPWFLAGWDNGFIMRSEDDNFRLRITGQVQADYRAFLPENDFVNTDQFFLRRARFGLEATLFQYYDFRFMPDFGQGKAVIQDAYMNVHYWESFAFETGKFKQPFSYEQLIQDRYVPLVERSMIDQLVPARDVGAMLHGENLFENRFEWGVSVSNGEINGNGDTNDRKDLAARMAVRPFNSEEFGPLFRGWLFGISVTTGIEQEPINPNTLTTPAGIPWFAFNSTVQANGLRNRWSPEVVYFNGPLGVAGQYFEQDQKLQPAFSGPTSKFIVNIPFEGFYVMGSLLLTGETRTTYSQEIVPIRPFDPRLGRFGPGAWELLARVSRLDVNEAVFAKGPTRLADPAKYSSGATEFTTGFNWYLNAWFRVQFNWEHAWFDDPVTLGPPPQGIHSQSDALMTRFQVIF